MRKKVISSVKKEHTMDRHELIEEICEMENENPRIYEDWSTEELQELYLNLKGLSRLV